MTEITPVPPTPEPEIKIEIQKSGRKLLHGGKCFIEWTTRDDLGYNITIGDPHHSDHFPLNFVAHYGQTTSVRHPTDRGRQVVVFDLLHEAVKDGSPKPWKLIARIYDCDEAVNY